MRRRNAFTLVEALIAVALGLAVLAIGVQLFTWSARALGRADQHLDARETALRAVAAIRDVLGDCTTYAIDPTGASIKVQSKQRTGTLKLDTGRLTFEKPGDTEVLARGVSALTLTRIARGLIRVQVRIDRPHVENKLADLGPLTLVDDVLVPMVSAVTPDTPWQKVALP